MTRFGARPSLVFILLDAFRADRFSAWGNPHHTTPNLDGLAAEGIRFGRHQANAHATRSSMPQLMSGRYYHPNILRSFERLSNPHEYPFRAPDPTARLLPELLRECGYQVLGVSAHPWVVRDCPFGRAFHRLDFLPAEPRRGHVDAASVVARAIALWRDRRRHVPTFLYVHLMDLHMPRWLPGHEPAFLPPGIAWRARFTEGSEPLFGHHVRLWDPSDASDFTRADRMIFTAFYDTALAHTDAEIGRLLAALRGDDPDLLVAAVADHGEHLGEDGRIGHLDSLSDCVQHIPFILAGAGLPAGQCLNGFSENVDVVPTLARVLGLEPKARVVFDGEPLVDTKGILSAERRTAAYYAWLSYQAIRTEDRLLRVDREGAPEVLARGSREILWGLDGEARGEVPIAGQEVERAAELRTALRRRLAEPEGRLAETLGYTPERAFFVPAKYWRLARDTALTCRRIGPQTRASDLRVRGWQYARDSFFILREAGDGPLRLSLEVPDGRYEVDAGVVPIGRPPRFLAFPQWLRKRFRHAVPDIFVHLGVHAAAGRQLALTIPAELGRRQRLITLRLTPPGAAAVVDKTEAAEEHEHEERLRALGYVE